MRTTIKQIICDSCGKTAPDYSTINDPNQHPMIVVSLWEDGVKERSTKDFCSKNCIVKWLDDGWMKQLLRKDQGTSNEVESSSGNSVGQLFEEYKNEKRLDQQFKEAFLGKKAEPCITLPSTPGKYILSLVSKDGLCGRRYSAYFYPESSAWWCGIRNIGTGLIIKPEDNGEEWLITGWRLE